MRRPNPPARGFGHLSPPAVTRLQASLAPLPMHLVCLVWVLRSAHTGSTAARSARVRPPQWLPLLPLPLLLPLLLPHPSSSPSSPPGLGLPLTRLQPQRPALRKAVAGRPGIAFDLPTPPWGWMAGLGPGVLAGRLSQLLGVAEVLLLALVLVVLVALVLVVVWVLVVARVLVARLCQSRRSSRHRANWPPTPHNPPRSGVALSTVHVRGKHKPHPLPTTHLRPS